MDRHFIESCEDERDVFLKIEELKAWGYAESDMYVVARSSEQLTMIRTRTNVEYHAAEGKGMDRFGMFIRSRHVFPYIMEAEVRAQEIAELYQHLSEGELLFFYNETNRVYLEDFQTDRNPPLSRYWIDEDEVDRISIDSQHYET